jgi:hypothetical protein
MMKQGIKQMLRLVLSLMGYQSKPSLAAQRRAVNYRWKKLLQAIR